MKTILLALLLAAATTTAQVTIRITSIPASTPAGADIYMAGSFNGWNPFNQNHIMQPDGLGAWTLTIPEGTGTVEYKFTRGSWATVEGNASGGFLPNRTFTFTGSPQVINVQILSWEDISGSGGNSTAAANVQVLSNSFFMPQLNRSRKIWIYLPPDYFTTTKHYPVLYMQDGQNLFDNQTAFAGEWNVDETLNTLHAQGDYGAIVIGIENGGALRLDEYSPWNNPSYGGGQGDLYMQFLGETLKPYVDANFRTLPQPEYNALIGSSMGAFISTYGVVKYPELFGKIGSFSPAYWFSLTNLNNYIASTSNPLSAMRIYFVAGTNESTTMTSNINIIKETLLGKGVQQANVFTKFDSFGTHTESYWSGEFAAAYQWLFQNVNLAIAEISATDFQYVQHSSEILLVRGLQQQALANIYSVTGQKLCSIQLQNGENALPHLSKGLYVVKIAGVSAFKIMK